MKIKIGHSYDVHRLEEGYNLILGGVKLEHDKGLVGHSDADVLLHAITESLIGAMGLGDIGTFFPDTDPTYKGVDSMKLLIAIKNIVDEKGFVISNIDSTVYLEQPKLRPVIDIMRENISKNINIDITCINIKATRGEKLGFVGREEGIAAESVVLLTHD